jgi:hypothetical protein
VPQRGFRASEKCNLDAISSPRLFPENYQE